MKNLVVSLSLCLLFSLSGIADAQKTCTRISATSQNCLATVSWTASVVDAKHEAPANYVIRRSDGGGAMREIGTVAATLTSFQNTFTDAGGIVHCWDVSGTKLTQASPPSSPLVCWASPTIK